MILTLAQFNVINVSPNCIHDRRIEILACQSIPMSMQLHEYNGAILVILKLTFYRDTDSSTKESFIRIKSSFTDISKI